MKSTTGHMAGRAFRVGNTEQIQVLICSAHSYYSKLAKEVPQAACQTPFVHENSLLRKPYASFCSTHTP